MILQRWRIRCYIVYSRKENNGSISQRYDSSTLFVVIWNYQKNRSFFFLFICFWCCSERTSRNTQVFFYSRRFVSTRNLVLFNQVLFDQEQLILQRWRILSLWYRCYIVCISETKPGTSSGWTAPSSWLKQILLNRRAVLSFKAAKETTPVCLWIEPCSLLYE